MAALASSASRRRRSEYYKVSPRDRLLVAAAYVAIVALLAFGMTETHIERDFGDV